MTGYELNLSLFFLICVFFVFCLEIVDGNAKMTLGMIWTIILRFAIQDISVEGKASICVTLGHTHTQLLADGHSGGVDVTRLMSVNEPTEA